jgi:hypothetical protein
MSRCPGFLSSNQLPDHGKTSKGYLPGTAAVRGFDLTILATRNPGVNLDPRRPPLPALNGLFLCSRAPSGKPGWAPELMIRNAVGLIARQHPEKSSIYQPLDKSTFG